MYEQIRESIGKSGGLQGLLVLILAVGLTFAVQLALKFIAGRWSKFAQRSAGRWDDIVVDCLSVTKSWAVFIWVLNPLMQFVDAANPGFHKFLNVVTVVATAAQVMIWGLHVIRGVRDDYFQKRIEQDASSASALNLMATAMKALFVVAVVLICLSNLGIDIGALIAGLGIGGIAVALAAQNILGDLFSSVSIVLDKPFVVGDYIVVGNDQGTVEYIGIKTTRVRSLSGEELIFSNKDLLESRIKNFKRMRERRVALNFSVPYTTAFDKVRQIPGWLRAFVEAEPMHRFERSHLSGIGKNALDFEMIYWVKDPDNNRYMDLQQMLFQQILAKFAQEKVKFAQPIQVVDVEHLPELVLGEVGGAMLAPAPSTHPS
jgi:small-conductance mechanosensitive channel